MSDGRSTKGRDGLVERVQRRARSVGAEGFAVFETAVGPCGIAWGASGVLGLTLPESGKAATRARLQQRFPDARETAPPPAVRRVTEGIAALLRGDRRAAAVLSAIPLDMAQLPPFHRRVYEAARAIGPGTTLSYGELATRLGSPGASRAVGQALGRNPFAILVPCHRILSAGGKIGGFTANGGTATKRRLLELEGTRVPSSAGG